MGQSTDGQICYGILLDDGIEFPWDADEFGGDEEGWWRKISDYKPLHVCFVSDDYAPGFGKTDPRVGEQFAHERAWLDANPLPFKMVNCCSGDYPIWIIAVPDSFISCYRGEPTKLLQRDEFSGMVCTPGVVSWDEVEALIAFCKKHSIAPDAIPAWYLSSYWG